MTDKNTKNTENTKILEVSDVKIEKEIAELRKLLQFIDLKLSIKYQVLRGFVYGIFQFIGATIGVALLFFILSQVLKGVDSVPILNTIVEKSGIVQIIREEVERYSFPSESD